MSQLGQNPLSAGFVEVERNGYAVWSGGIVGGTLVRILSALTVETEDAAIRSVRCDMSGLIYQVVPAADPPPDQVERSKTS
jgi:hypothetical protein